MIFILIGAIALAFAWFQRSTNARAIPDAVLATGRAAGCGAIQTPAGSDPSREHISPGVVPSYASVPAAAGAHNPSPLPPDTHVYTAPIPETQAVHNLEDAYVLIYYRADGTSALSVNVVQALASLANSQWKVIMAPYPTLPVGISFSVVAWNKLWSCPGSVTQQQALTIASGFIQAYRGTNNAPEPGAP